MDEIQRRARAYRVRQDRIIRWRDSLALIIMTLLALYLTFDQMIL